MFVASTATVDKANSKKAETEGIVLIMVVVNEDIPRIKLVLYGYSCNQDSTSWAYLRFYLCI